MSAPANRISLVLPLLQTLSSLAAPRSVDLSSVAGASSAALQSGPHDARRAADNAETIARACAQLGTDNQTEQHAQILWNATLAQIAIVQKNLGLPPLPFQSSPRPPA